MYNTWWVVVGAKIVAGEITIHLWRFSILILVAPGWVMRYSLSYSERSLLIEKFCPSWIGFQFSQQVMIQNYFKVHSDQSITKFIRDRYNFFHMSMSVLLHKRKVINAKRTWITTKITFIRHVLLSLLQINWRLKPYTQVFNSFK